jgi:hypothetical protein
MSRVADAKAAAALAQGGDQRQVERLRAALVEPDTVVVAARALAALRVDLCAMVDPALRARDPAASELAMTVLREGAGAAAGASCLAVLGELVDDVAAPKPLRASALKTLAALDRAALGKRPILLLGDSSPELRAAAALAFAQPGGGRPILTRLAPLLKDANVEVRAAAAEAAVRAAGELSFEQLQPLFMSQDDRPLVAIVPALGELSSEASADLLAKIFKRGPEVEEPVLRALARRTDDKARLIFKPLADEAKKNPQTSNELRLFLYASAPVDELLPLAKDPLLGILAYKAMLRAGHHAEAADWIVARFDSVSPVVLAEAFAAWLTTPPRGVAAAQ